MSSKSTVRSASGGSTALAARRSRQDPWPVGTLAAILIVPAACAAVLIGADIPWRILNAIAEPMVASLSGSFETVRERPGHAVDALRMLIASAIAAAPPAFGLGLFEAHGATRVYVAAVFYPLWLIIMVMPAAVVHALAYQLDAPLLDGHLAANFLVLFCAATTSIAMIYSLWGTRREAFRNRFAPVETA